MTRVTGCFVPFGRSLPGTVCALGHLLIGHNRGLDEINFGVLDLFCDRVAGDEFLDAGVGPGETTDYKYLMEFAIDNEVAWRLF